MSIQGVKCEALKALVDIEETSQEYGTQITFNLRSEQTVVRDTYNTIKQYTVPSVPIILWALPVERNPDQKKLENAGVRTVCDVIVYTPWLSWDKAGIAFDDIDITRATVVLDGTTWKVTDKGMPQRIGDQPLYITLGLNRG